MDRFICPECKGPVEYIPGKYEGTHRLYCRNCGKTLTQAAIDKSKRMVRRIF